MCHADFWSWLERCLSRDACACLFSQLGNEEEEEEEEEEKRILLLYSHSNRRPQHINTHKGRHPYTNTDTQC
jgi:hypothetical protein